MLGGNAIAFAMVKWGKHREGVRLKVGAEGAMVEAVVQKLRFLP
jgi:glycine cleavage system aminomethyltransferase T